MYLAVYNSDGTLKGIAKADATLGDSEVILSVPGDYTQGGYTSKVMLWSKSKLKPLEKSIVSIIQ